MPIKIKAKESTRIQWIENRWICVLFVMMKGERMSNMISGSYGTQNPYAGITYFKREANGDTDNSLATPEEGGELEQNWMESADFRRSSSTASMEDSETEELSDEDESYLEMLQEYIDQIFTKIQNGDTETKFQIGSESLTEKEWDQMLEKFDSQEDAIKEAVEEEIEKRKQEEQEAELRKIAKTEELSNVAETDDVTKTLESEKDFMKALNIRQQERLDENERIQSELLTSDSLLAESTTESGTKELHIMWMTEEGIFCRKQGQTSGYEWMIAFDSEDQYRRMKELFEFWEKYLTEDVYA
jgi:hypothetical protein